MAGLFESKKRRVEDAMSEALKNQIEEELSANEDELFVPAEYDASTAEKTGYSNYSYWGSTVRGFFKNRMAVLMLVVLAMASYFISKAKKPAPAAGPAEEPVVKAAPAAEKPKAPVAPGTAGELKLYDTDPKDAAMIMAIVADATGKPLNELRFISIREVK